ncbi:hypothetical protein HQ586_02355 [Candidatus Bathyarchaeota archaeon]|nr:hypothetical protein [Candidatus Bathyarchaeota archaeon]
MRIERNVKLEDLAAELRMIPGRIEESAQLALQMPSMVAAAKAFCPVNTGALMTSIRAEAKVALSAALVAGGGGFINPRTGRPVDYARHVHDGTSHMPARPFLLQAVLSERLRFIREMFARTAGAV